MSKKLIDFWPKVNRLRGDLINAKVEGRLSEADAALLATLNRYADSHLSKQKPQRDRALGIFEKTLKITPK